MRKWAIIINIYPIDLLILGHHEAPLWCLQIFDIPKAIVEIHNLTKQHSST